MAKDRGFLLALSFESKIGAQLSLVDDIFEQRGLVFVIVRTAHDLADLSEGEAQASRFLQEKGRYFHVFEAFGSYLKVRLNQTYVCVDVKLRDVVKCPLRERLLSLGEVKPGEVERLNG